MKAVTKLYPKLTENIVTGNYLGFPNGIGKSNSIGPWNWTLRNLRNPNTSDDDKSRNSSSATKLNAYSETASLGKHKNALKHTLPSPPSQIPTPQDGEEGELF